jgi:two-component system, NarL family, sensor histidine kinase UhpB
VSVEAGQVAIPMPSPASDGLERVLAGVVCEVFWERDVESDVVRWSGNLESIFGYQRSEVLNSFAWWRERVHPDDIDSVLREARLAMDGSTSGFSCEYRFRRKDDSWAWVAARSVIARDESSKALRILGAMIDITKLKEAESRLRLFTRQLPARATVTDRDLRVIWDAGAAYAENPSTVGKTVAQLFADSPDRERVLEGCRKALAGETVRLEIDDGAAAADLQLAPFRDPAGNITGVVGLALDVTDRKRAEVALRESRELFRTILATLPVGLVVMDRDGNKTLANPAMDGIWGQVIVSGEKRWQRSAGYWHHSGEKIESDQWASVRALKQDETTLNELIDIDTFDGRRKIIENSAAPIHGPDGRVMGAVVVNQDVTERVQAEETLRKTQRLLMDAERLGLTGSWEMDLVAGAIFNSESSRRLFFGDDKTKGDRLEDYAEAVHPEDRDRVMQARAAMLDGTGPSDIEYRVVWPDGSTHVIFARATVVRDDSGKAIRVYGTNADITQRKRTEVELARRAQQLESLSRKLIQAQETERRALSNELHDDLGQMLFALKLNLERNGKGDAESMSLLEGAISRMRDLVQALRPPLLDEYGLEASLRWHVEREAARAGLAFNLDVAPLDKRPPVTVEITCFRIAQEALSNAIRHAGAHRIDVELREADGRLQLTVRDDGQGFDAPAARTRAATGGSQGLLSMQERAGLVGGELEIDSAPGRGTTLRASLPLRQNGRR